MPVQWCCPQLGKDRLVPLFLGSAAIQGPKEVSGYVGGSLTVTCNYEATFEKYRKSWCFGENWSSCKILVETTGTEQGVKKNRVTLRDSQRDHRFTVTMERLRLDDTDTYWCGIEGVKPKQVQVTVALGTGRRLCLSPVSQPCSGQLSGLDPVIMPLCGDCPEVQCENWVVRALNN